MIAAILAHQGGWDEMLMVAGPIAIFALILRRANKRAEKADLDSRSAPDAEDGDPDGDDGLDSVRDGVQGGDVGPE